MPAVGRVVEVDARRLTGWLERFAERHGTLSVELVDPDAARQTLVYEAADGARAAIAVPYGPLPGPLDRTPLADRLVAHLQSSRTIGLLLVRRGGWAAAVVMDQDLLAADFGGGYVRGRTRAGGWSQQRFARRRGNQTLQVWQRAADGATGVLLPHRNDLDTLVTGGDRAGVAAVLADPRLVDLGPIVEPRFLAVPDPRRSVLDDVVRRLSSVVITLNDRA